ncbi:porin [Rhodomicrobium vannielii ATCC 17100]|jgi:outer membrane immunogenic protein|uniref:Porin n=1 Tax=Rhodomicrobium vannielii (strain ATCC 17100 / DSM 162 / LMG 4299 / NCIMB 10020 / ATH 3.1.1) TaxID=648757 RepID=E3I1M3_RHOVT|nr:outer membrane beta-barrel protein [Rhodomicrobium vannielii]ADP72398.1 porin [Rhodomicrobium vannielii ATCC 17100]
MKKILLGVASFVALSSSAFAADLYKGSLKDAPVYEAPAIWTGLYVGAHGGYAWDSIDFPGTPSHANGGAPRPDLEGGFVGGQIGYNYQFDKIVVGVVADISAANLEKTERDGNYLNETTSIDKFGTVRAILGYSFGKVLPYATVGYGWTSLSYKFGCPDALITGGYGGCNTKPSWSPVTTPSANRTSGFDATTGGLVYGGGVKYAIDNRFSIGVEYLRFDKADETADYAAYAYFPASKTKIETETDTVKLSVDYKVFGGSIYEPLK